MQGIFAPRNCNVNQPDFDLEKEKIISHIQNTELYRLPRPVIKQWPLSAVPLYHHVWYITYI